MTNKEISDDKESFLDDVNYYFNVKNGQRTIIFLSSIITIMLILSLLSKTINIILVIVFCLTWLLFYYRMKKSHG